MKIMGLEAYKGVYVFAQQVDNVLSGIAFELLGKAKDLAKDLSTDVTAVLIGSGVKDLADQLAEYGADKVIVVDDPELKEYRTEPYTHALSSVINEYKPEIMLVGATAIGRDLGPRVSARVKTGLTADCTVLEIGDFPLNPVPGKENEQKHNQLSFYHIQDFHIFVIGSKSWIVFHYVCFCTLNRIDFLHNAGTYGCHLRTVVRTCNSCDCVAAKCRTGHKQLIVFLLIFL